MGLYGIFGSHTTESCPLNNQQNRKTLIQNGSNFEAAARKFNIQIVGQFHSALEHTFLWVLDAKDAQTVENLMIETSIAKFNALKIVPLLTFKDVIEKCKKIENSSN